MEGMFKLKNKMKLYAVSAVGLLLLLIPCKCFADSAAIAKEKANREKLVAYTKKFVGCPYVRGAIGPNAFDCSGLIFTCSRESIGHQLPRTVAAIYKVCTIVPDEKLEPGDLVFFKTTDGVVISHVGLYIGNKQFISAVSDGPNTGVIVSSLRENYWKNHYACGGKFLKDTKTYETSVPKGTESAAKEKPQTTGTAATAPKTSDAPKTAKAKPAEKAEKKDYKYTIDNLNCTTSLGGDWALFTHDTFIPNFRGLTASAGLFYYGKYITPGFQCLVKWNHGLGCFEIPLVGTIEFCQYVLAYAGPVFTIGKTHLPKSEEEINPSIFPGVAGIRFMTPSLLKGDVKLRFMQDLCYTFFNNMDGSALGPVKALAAGLNFSTGVTVTFPYKVFLR